MKGIATISLCAVALATMLGVSPTRAEVRIGLGAPLTGTLSWSGGETEEGAEFAVADLNARGGVLGEQVELITADDFCDAEQAVAAANKLVAHEVAVVLGHQCSGAAIPASRIYAEAGLLLISTLATNPKLTEQGLSNVFRMVGRDDAQGRVAADLFAERWSDARIAVLHDGEAYGEGVAQEMRKGLNEHGISEAMFAEIAPGQVDYFDIVEQLRAGDIAVLYYGGYAREAALISRQAQSAGYDLRIVGADGLADETYGLIAGPASDGTLMTSIPDPRANPGGATLSARLTNPSPESAFTGYAAVQAWAQAVEIAGTFETEAVVKALRGHQFDTVLGTIGFDAKGDVTGYDTFVWYVWKDGDYAPIDPGALTD